jgi:hypothetical protein
MLTCALACGRPCVQGGAMQLADVGALTVRSATFAGNRAAQVCVGGGAAWVEGRGGVPGVRGGGEVGVG